MSRLPLDSARPPDRRAAAFVLASLVGFVAVLVPAGRAAARETVRVAVAANFTDPAREIARRFEAATGHGTQLSFGATGHFYAQIARGAPFDVLLAADAATPARAIAEGHAVAGTAFTYAVGRLVLYSRTSGLVTGAATLREGRFRHLAIANPETAPYGAAAVEAMRVLGVHAVLAARLVTGTSIAQAFQFVVTGNAELGFVALAQVSEIAGGSRWLVPSELHTPIRQDAVLLRAAGSRLAPRAFLAFLAAPEARGAIERFGYGFE